ncbi:MAG: hypothetical protein H7Z72_02850 [Bacteroidetes bacterium]|nr:hypothetical protein [Fibrella sp.]
MSSTVDLARSWPERLALIYLAGTNLLPGVWALFFPTDFYRSFPGFGRIWVAVDGPYNEHFVRDVGAFSLVLTLLPTIALVSPRLVTYRAVGLCTLVFSVPHLLYHLRHLSMLPVIDQVGNVVILSAGVLVPLGLLVFGQDRKGTTRGTS